MSQTDGPDHDGNVVSESVEVSSDHSAGTSAPMVDLHACGICFQLYDESERLPKVLTCGHTNCLACLNSWAKHNSSPFPVCSICRRVTRKPVKLLATNFQLLQVLRRMKLISAEAHAAVSPEQQKKANSARNDNVTFDMSAVCEQVDEHMHEIASLLETQMEALSVGMEESTPSDQGLLFRMLETSVADLLSRWDSTKDYLLEAEKRRASRSSSRESLSISADFSGISAVIYDALQDETSGIFDLMPLHVPSFDNVGLPSSENSHFDGIYDWGGESDTLTHAYSDFSLFGSESHDTAVSASQSSSQEESYPNFVGWEESPTFPHISTFHGPLTSYSRCSLCQCRLSTSFASHQTHVRGRRHQQFMGSLNEANPSSTHRFGRRPHTEAGRAASHASNSNQSNRPSSTNAASAGASPQLHDVDAGFPQEGRNQTAESLGDPWLSSHQENNARFGRNNRRNIRAVAQNVPGLGNPHRSSRGARGGSDANRGNHIRGSFSRRLQPAGFGRRNMSSNTWQNQEWPVAGWGLPYGYNSGWSFGYGGYIQ